jgi:uncharacterized repeat protein (TIGR03803 family)
MKTISHITARASLAILAITCVVRASPAQTPAAAASPRATLHTLFNFPAVFSSPSMIQAADGNFYGNTRGDGTNGRGTIFKLTGDGVYTIIHDFTAASDGADPNGIIQASDGNFYGTTSYGGANNKGTVFRITPAGVVTTLHDFAGSDGRQSVAALVQGSDRNLYGTAGQGGANDEGTIFRIATSGQFTVLHSFASGDGRNPAAALIQAKDGNFYGVTEQGSSSDGGAVFTITPSGTYSVLTNIASGGFQQTGVVQASDGNFYGTATSGGSRHAGFVFSVTPAGTLSTIYEFNGGGDGGHPRAGLTAAPDGNLYGTASLGGGPGGNGTVFKLTLSGAITTIYRFEGGIDGRDPQTAPLLASDGNFYGTTRQRGAHGYGLAYKLTTAGVFTSLTSFPGHALGSVPSSGLTPDGDGNLYGSTAQGGDQDFLGGTVFKLSSSGSVSTLASFTGSVNGGVVRGSDNAFYGTTTFGGANGAGSVFKITPEGIATTLYSFTAAADGSEPRCGLLKALDGNFYGITTTFGGNGHGTVFSISESGAFATIYSFTGAEDPNDSSKENALVRGSDGNIYGSLAGNGDTSYGVIFKVTQAGAFTALHTFSGAADGTSPSALILANDGNFYGTTYEGGSGFGTIFRIAADGTFSTLYTFTGNSDVGNPDGSLIQASDGNFYGTAGVKGSVGGSVYRITTDGAFSTVYLASFLDPVASVGPLFEAGDGSLYGTAQWGGVPGNGTIYQLVLDPPIAAPSPTPTSTPTASISPTATPARPLIISAGSTSGSVGQQFIYQIVASNQATGYSATNLPAGLSFDSTLGVITGVPTSDGTFAVTIGASNASGSNTTQLTITIDPAPATTGTSPVIASGAVTGKTGQPFSYQVIATGVTSAATISAGGLPAGLSINPTTGFISGTPSEDGSSNVSLALTDGPATATGTLQLTFTSDPAFPIITSPPTADLVGNQPFTFTITAPGGSDPNDPVTYTLVGTLPPGLTFDPATGVISGTYTPGGAARRRGSLVGHTGLTNIGGEVLKLLQIFAHNSHGTAGATLTFLTAPPAAAVNLSTRLNVGTDADVLIGGFIVTGNAPKKVIVRAIAPSLNVGGVPVPGTLQDPTLELHDGSGVLIKSNDNWRSDQEQEINDSTVAPADDRESAIVTTLQPGNYTAIVAGKDNSTGVALVELYDLDPTNSAHLAQISTRGKVLTNTDVMIGGFIIRGTATTNVLVRAIGPELTQNGVPGALSDTTLELRGGNGDLMASNDEWQSDQEQAIRDTTVPPNDPHESAILSSLSAGNYTAIVRGKGDTTGVGLVEIYVLN